MSAVVIYMKWHSDENDDTTSASWLWELALHGEST